MTTNPKPVEEHGYVTVNNKQIPVCHCAGKSYCPAYDIRPNPKPQKCTCVVDCPPDCDGSMCDDPEVLTDPNCPLHGSKACTCLAGNVANRAYLQSRRNCPLHALKDTPTELEKIMREYANEVAITGATNFPWFTERFLAWRNKALTEFAEDFWNRYSDWWQGADPDNSTKQILDKTLKERLENQ